MSYDADLGVFVIGHGTSYPWASFPTGFGTPEVRARDVERTDRDGVLAGIDLLGGRLVVFDVLILGTSAQDAETKLNALKAFFARADTDVDLVVTFTGVVSYGLVGRPRGCDVVFDRQTLSGVMRARCSFLATDPRLYRTNGSEDVTIQMAGGGTGLTFNASADFSFGGAVTGGALSVVNQGTYPTPFTATFHGPLTGPQLEHVDLGLTLAFTGDLLAGQTLVVDTDKHTVLLNGVSSRYSWLTVASRWYDLVPGTNLLRLLAVSGSGSVDIGFRSAYV